MVVLQTLTLKKCWAFPKKLGFLKSWIFCKSWVFKEELGFQKKPGYKKKGFYRKNAFQIQKVLGFQREEKEIFKYLRLKVYRKMTSNKQLGVCMSLMGHGIMDEFVQSLIPPVIGRDYEFDWIHPIEGLAVIRPSCGVKFYNNIYSRSRTCSSKLNVPIDSFTVILFFRCEKLIKLIRRRFLPVIKKAVKYKQSSFSINISYS